MKDCVFAEGSENLENLMRLLERGGISVFPLRKNGYTLFFVYSRKLLERLFCRTDSMNFLSGKGYPVDDGLDAILSELFLRLVSEDGFPHEIGFFLGYPLDDVVQFEKKGGRGFIYSGFWKVYGNLDVAVSKMNMYRSCMDVCMDLFRKGAKVHQIAEMYRKRFSA